MICLSTYGVHDLPEEALEGWDIASPSRSHFATLLDDENASLLQDFVEDKVVQAPTSEKPKAELDSDDPEQAFLGISTALRGALKKHYDEVR